MTSPIKKKFILLFFSLALFGFVNNLYSQLFGAGYQTVIKSEYQYSDYLKYTYPDPILYEYPDVPYSQPLPYIFSFPEHRFLTKITQYFGFDTNLGLRYQFSQLDKSNQQYIYYSRLTHELSDLYSIMGTYQFMELKNTGNSDKNYSGHMFEVGGKFNFAGAIHIEPSYGYYTSSYVSPEAKKGGAHSFQLLLRQAFSSTTALQVKYNYFYVDYTTKLNKRQLFCANTLTFWFSQYLPTETAIHLSTRLYWNYEKTKSFSPSIDVIQYLNWKTVLQFSYRFYYNKPKSEAFLERIAGDSFSNHAYSAILDYSFSANTKILLKYRFYSSDQNIKMSTYVIGLEQIL
jgi:hypothetical protein